jgi:hypothetical protein
LDRAIRGGAKAYYDKYDIGSYQKVIPMYGDEENKVAAQELREIAKRISNGH